MYIAAAAAQWNDMAAATIFFNFIAIVLSGCISLTKKIVVRPATDIKSFLLLDSSWVHNYIMSCVCY